MIAELNSKELEEEMFDREVYRRYIITKMQYEIILNLLTYNKNFINGINFSIWIVYMNLFILRFDFSIFVIFVFVGGGVCGWIWSLFEKLVCKCSLFGGGLFPTESYRSNYAYNGIEG